MQLVRMGGAGPLEVAKGRMCVLRFGSNLLQRLKGVGMTAAVAVVVFAPAVVRADELGAAVAGDVAVLPHVDAGLLALLPRDLSPWGMFMGADIVVKLVLIGLAFASVLTWTVWLAKSLELAAARRRVLAASLVLSKSTTLSGALMAVGKGGSAVQTLVQAADFEMRLSADSAALDKDGIKERVGSRLERLEAAVGRRLGLGTGVLATVGATAPFVGLFGTVWGIMNSFIGISQSQTTNLAVVAPGIAEALLATAMGLVAAIPAVVIYNMFVRMIGVQRAMVADAAAEVLRLVSRDLDRQGAQGSRKAAE